MLQMCSFIRRIGFILLTALQLSAFSQSNYTFTPSTAPYVPISGTEVTLELYDNQISDPINLGFSFKFDGIDYTQILASVSGYITFNTSLTESDVSSWRNGNLTNCPMRPLIGALYYDNDKSYKASSVARYATSGTAPNRVFTFEWYCWKFHNYTNNDVCIQIKLYETSNKIEMYYLTQEEYFTQYDVEASIGLAFNNIGDYLSVSSFNANAIASSEFESHYFPGMPNDNQKYTFTPITTKVEPTGQCSNLVAQNVAENIMLTWNDAVGAVIPDGYLIMASETNSFTPPTDGTFLTQDNDLSDGSGIVKVLAGKQFYSGWKNAKASTNYYFKAFAYTNGGNRVNYNTTNAPTAQISLVKSAPKNHVTNLTASIVKNKFLLKWNDVKRFGNALVGKYCMPYESCRSYADCGNNTLFNITGNQITLEAWVNPARYNGGIFQKENVALDGGYRMYINSQGQLCFGLYIGGSWSEVKTASGILPINSWSHICGTYNGTTQSIYISGVLVASKSTTGNITSSSVNLFIGRDHSTNYESYEGLIDEMAIWSTARTQTQIVSDMNLNLTGSETGLVAYYKCENNLNDATPNAINATIINNEYGTRYQTSNTNSEIDGYVIQASNTNSFPALVNGTDGTNDLDLTDNVGVVKVDQGVQKDSSWINASASQTYYFRVVPYVNQGTNIIYNTTDTIPVVSVKAEPTNHVTNFTASGVNGNIILNWTDATGTQIPEGYVILASTSPSITAPVNGSEIGIDNNLADGAGAVKVLPGVQAYSAWTGFVSGITYYFCIYPYTNSGSSIAYKTNGTVPQVNGKIMIYGEPTNQATGLTASNNGLLTLKWNDAQGIPSLMSNALNFDGLDDAVTCTGSQNPAVFTAEVWYSTASLADMAMVSTLTTNSNTGFEIHSYEGKPVLTLRNGGAWLDILSPSAVPANSWNHVALTYDGTTAKLYVNGQLVNSAAIAAANYINGSATLNIGRRASGGLNFSGSIDEVRMWTTVRTQAEIQNSMYSELAGNESGLLSYYKFNQGTAGGTNTGITTLIDASTNAFNGTLTNFTLSGSSSNWINPGQGPAGYVLMASTSSTFTAPVDGTDVAVDRDISDGSAVVKVAQDLRQFNGFTGTKGNTTYYFKMWPYTNAGNYVNYKTDGTVPTASINYLKTTPATHVSNLTANNNNKLINLNWTDARSLNMGNAIALDGTNDYITVPDGSIDNGGNTAFTIETWVKWTSASASNVQFICGKGFEQMEIHTAGAGANSLRFIPTTGVYLDAVNVLPLNTWTHVAVVYDATNRMYKMYINGVDVHLSKSGAGAIGTSLQNTTSAFDLGRRPSIASLYFNGSLDEFRVWNKVRSQAEIVANMYNELSASETGLLAYYKFNQGVENGTNTGLTSVTDASSLANNGTLTNSALTGSTSNWISFRADAPDGYLIKASKNNSFTAPVNGTVVTDDNNLADGVGAVNVLAGVQTYNGWANFGDTTAYYFKVYPYSNTSTSRVYNTSAPVPVVKDSVGIDEFKDVSSFLELTQGSSAWADYNNDGLMDLLLTGGNSYNAQKQLINSITRLYQQNADHSFSIVDKGFPQVSKGSVAWADYNNDGLLDLIISGATGYYPLNGNVAGIITRLYKQNSDNSFTYVSSANFPNVYKSSIAWIDYNNDGDLDLLISGYQNVAPFYITKIYKNMGNDTFKEQTEILFDNVIEGSVAVGDYNKDGFDDVLISGYGDRVGNVTKLYKNNGEGLLLEQENLSLPVSNSPSVNFMDYNNDGYPDILIDDKICKNNQNGGFEEIKMDSILEYDYVSNDIGDFNNDGLPDILITGDDANRVSQEWVYSYLYKQLPNQTFSRSDFSFINMVYGDAKFIDYDNDGNLDVFLSGESYSQACQLCDLTYTVQTKLYKNTEFKKNQKPSIPTNLKYELGQSVKFSWNPSSDLETPSAALTYNIKIGTTKNGGEIVNPTASANNGYKSLPGIGNCGSNTFATYKLKVGQKYYWSVQSVDNGYLGSNFSQVDSLIYDSIPSSNLSLKVQDSHSVLAKWKRGNGSRSAVFVKMKYKDATLETSAPVQGTTYLGVSRFLSGPKIENTSWYCVYNGIEDSVLITNLDPYSLYAIHIVEYIEDSGTPRYFRVNSAMKDNYGIFNTNDYLRNTTGFNETCFADFNNDGYLDILNVKPNGGIIEGFLWKNEGDNDFTSSSLAFQTSLNSNIKQINKPVVADFNNDGLMDFVVCGSRDTSLNSTEISFTNLYKNNGDGTFTLQIGAFSKEVCMGSVSWGDFNNDSKVDLLMCGNPWGSRSTDSSITCIFVNHSTLAHTQFDLLTNTNFVGIQDGSAAWADFNNDGYLDFAISGSENDSYQADGILDIARLYRNNKNETFTEIVLNKGKSKRGYLDETCFWNDFDNDGDLDLKIEGDDGFFIVTNNFPDTTFFEGSVAESFFNYSNKADYDNDGDLDEVTGSIQRNNFNYYPGNFASNKKPATPTNLKHVNLPGYVQLMWDNIISDETPSSQMSYNIRLRKEGSSQWLCAPQTMDDGSRLIPNFGNSPFRPNGLNNFARYNLPEGNYEWQVQAIDGSFSGSEWSELNSFTVKAALASFTAEPVCLGDTTIFIDNSFSFVGIKEWRWDFGDIPTVTGKMQKHVFQTTGDHTVRLIITNNNLQNDTVYGIAHVKPIPTVSFTADDVCEGLTATIVNSANTNGLIDWIWDFGDGSTSNYFNPGTHTYAEKKNYTIKFKVTGENNCSNTATKTIAIKERPAKPTISESTNNFCPGTEVKLEVTSTTNGLNFQWKRNGDIIDGATNSIYTGKLTAADYSVVVEPGSCSSESNKLTIVTKPAPPKPTILGHGPNVWILACDNMNATNYKWYFNNNLIPGANNYQYVANKNYGDYYVSVNEGGECWTPSDVFKVELPNEIDDLSFENVKVFPNPSEGIFNISLGSNITGEVNVRVVNVLGKVVLSQINSASEFPIDISHVTNGIYYISLMHKNEVIIKKVVKQ